MPRISQKDAERIHRLTDESMNRLAELNEARMAFSAKRNALIGAMNLVADEVDEFNPLEDGISEAGEVIKGGATEVQKALIMSDAKARKVVQQHMESP